QRRADPPGGTRAPPRRRLCRGRAPGGRLRGPCAALAEQRQARCLSRPALAAGIRAVQRARRAGRRGARSRQPRPRRACPVPMEEGSDQVSMDVSGVKELADTIRAELRRAIVGQDEAIELMLIALFASGHILLEGPPGTAKTFLV